MRVNARRVFITLLIAGCLGGGVVFFHVYPYVKAPSQSAAELEGWVAKWEGRVHEFRTRPPDDREAFNAMMEQMRPLWEAVDNFTYDGCPPFDEDKFETYAPVFDEAARYDTEWDRVLADGFLWQDDGAPRLEPPWGQSYRRWVNLQLWLAVAGDDPVPRLMRLHAINAGLRDCSTLFNVVNTIGIERITDTATVYLLPRLKAEDIHTLGREMTARSDVAAATIDAIAIGGTARATTPNDVLHELRGKMPFRQAGWLLRAADFLGWTSRERFCFIGLHKRLDEELRTWYAEGAGGPTPGVRGDAKRTTVYAAGVMPPVRTYLRVGLRQMQRRNAVVRALRAELQRRERGERAPFRLKYDGGQDIVVDQKFGCIMPRQVPPAKE
ncbi:MAG: hypothetical protein P9L99_09430 [Candidatus Lernaella stagnicola]|nr:hypothetical protein [Candidatus Lernaella stagnicola]